MNSNGFVNLYTTKISIQEGKNIQYSAGDEEHYAVRSGGDTNITTSPRTNNISIFLLDV
jgi:hypothetical protein